MMKTKMYSVMVIICLFFWVTSCTTNNFVDSGISRARFDGNMLEYMAAHSYDWDSTLVMIRHAGNDVVRIFEGKDDKYKEITFFGLTNHSIRRYLLEKGLKRVDQLDVERCKNVLLQHIVDKKIYRDDIPTGKSGDFGSVGSGGMTFQTIGGTTLWVYVVLREEGGIVENAAKPIFVNFRKSGREFGVASGDIQPDNGIIHSLEYKFTFGDEE